MRPSRIAWALLLLGYGASAAPDVEQAKSFLTVLLARDEKALSRYADAAFFPSGRLEPAAANFLYADHGEWKSVTSIARSGKLEIVLVPQAKGTVIVLYVLADYRDRLEDPAFLSGEWMKKYFACEFSTTGPGFRLANNFCFAETDGPFPGDAG